jgi:hypothetical protein
LPLPLPLPRPRPPTRPPHAAQDFALQAGALLARLPSGQAAALLDRGHAQLSSDVSAFKAANPGCMLQDFLAWHGGASALGNHLAGDASISGGGPGSAAAALQGPGAPQGPDLAAWREVFDRAPPLPAAKQQPLLDASVLAEELLAALLGLGAAEVLGQLALLLARASLSGERAPQAPGGMLDAALGAAALLELLLRGAALSSPSLQQLQQGGDRACGLQATQVLTSVHAADVCRKTPHEPVLTGGCGTAAPAGASLYSRRCPQLATAAGQAGAALEQLQLQAGGDGWARLDADSLDVLLGTLDAAQEVLLGLSAGSAAGEAGCLSGDDCPGGRRPAGAEGGEDEAWVLV